MSEAAKKLEGVTLQKLLLLVKTHTGITMEERKRELLFARIRPRLRVLGLESVEEYTDKLSSNPSEVQEFVNLVTTNETVFFRTPIIWEHFQKEFLTEWFRKNPDQTLRIWSAASSSGEEAHSIAMSCEEFKIIRPQFKYRVFGSDISTDVLGIAKDGIYEGKTIEDFKNRFAVYFSKYFKKISDKQYKISDEISKNIEFSIHNLHSRSPRSEFYDAVFLRNVLIYFNTPDQELVLKNVHASLKKEGTLFLGESESLARLKVPYTFKKPLIYQKEG